MLVTECLLPHVTEANGALAATVYEHVAAGRVELRGCDHLRQFLHVGRLDIHNVWLFTVKRIITNKTMAITYLVFVWGPKVMHVIFSMYITFTSIFAATLPLQAFLHC